jgi:hypothetical protein
VELRACFCLLNDVLGGSDVIIRAFVFWTCNVTAALAVHEVADHASASKEPLKKTLAALSCTFEQPV